MECESMNLRFQRVKSYIGFAWTMKIYIDDELIYRLKNGEVFEIEVEDFNTIKVDTSRFIADVKIPNDDLKTNVDILLRYQTKFCLTKTQAIVSEQGKLIGVYPKEEK
jgi:hypothetical protein